MKHFYSSLVLACFFASTLWAADDPFIGKWKLNMEKSKFTGEQTKIEDLVVMKKVSGGSGWGGTWEDTDVKFTSPDEWEIQAYEGDGLSFNTPAYKDSLSMKFDGKDYEEKGPNVAPGSMSSGKRINAHTLEVTDKVKGEVMDHTKFEVSPDGKTLTLTVHGTGQANAQTVVYNRM